MVFSIEYPTYKKLSKEEKKNVSEIRYPYFDQLKAFQFIKENPGVDILFYAGVLSGNFETTDLSRECGEIASAFDNVKFLIDEPNTKFIETVGGDKIILSRFTHSVYSENAAMGIYNLGIRNLYVTGSLAADTSALLSLKEKGIKIRIVVNAVQADSPTIFNTYNIPVSQSFWLRPQGLRLYKDIVDKFEFLSNATDKLEQGLLEIYSKEEWNGYLSDFLINRNHYKYLPIEYLKSDYSLEIDKMRSKCGLACQHSNRCHLCLLIKLNTERGKNEKGKKG